MIDFRTWAAGRTVFRPQDGVCKICPVCKDVGAAITYLPGKIVHIAGWEPIPEHPPASRLVAGLSCKVKP